MIKVLFNTYPTAFQVPGGGEMQIIAYRNILSKLGIGINFYNQWNPKIDSYDLIHFFSVFGGSIAFCEMIRSLQKPLVISSSLWISEETKNQYPFDEIRYQLSLANKIITNSVAESLQLSKVFNIPFNNFSVVYNGIDEQFFTPGDPTLIRKLLPNLGDFFLNVANIEPRKNQLALIKAVKKFKDFKLLLIGHIRSESYLKECLEEGGEQVIFLGPLDHASDLLKSCMASADLFLMPSFLETPSISALEAAAQGCKIVITKIGSTKEYFENDVEYIDPISVKSITNAINLSLEKKKNWSLSERIVKNYGWSKVAANLIPIYESLL
jgi:glycosyltransferase involved in cell wall biosynthesis